MEAIAKTKYLKGSPRKARLVIDLIRGVNVSRALSILKFTDKRAAEPIAQCLNSAIANATYKAEQQNIAIDPDDLWINDVFRGHGPDQESPPNASRLRRAVRIANSVIIATSRSRSRATKSQRPRRN